MASQSSTLLTSQFLSKHAQRCTETATANGNGETATRQQKNGNGMVETGHKSSLAA